jgi:hypothetical protein
MASLDDILTTQKNGVVAINSIAQTTAYAFAYERGSALSQAPAGTGTYSILYAVPSTTQVTLTDIEICNTGTATETFYISIVPAGGTAGASNALFYAAPILPKMTVQWSGNIVMTANVSVQAYASSANVNIFITGSPGGPR